MPTNAQSKNPDNRAAKSSPKTSARPSVITENFLLGALVLLILTFAVYLPPLQKAGFIWDDDGMLTANEFVQSPDGLHSIWLTTKPVDYLPLTMSLLWLEWHQWGMNPLNYHVVSLILHALSVVLLWRVLRQLKIPGAWWAALIFSLHPVNVESVAWIAEIKNTLSMFFFALALLGYLKFDAAFGTERIDETSNLKLQTSNPHRAWPLDKNLAWYFVALISFALALLSKQSVVMLPVVLLGCAWWRRNKISIDDFLRSVPFFLLSAAAAYVAIWFQYNRSIGEHHVFEADMATRVAVAGLNVWFYLYKALLPLNLIFVYPHWLEVSGLNDSLTSHALLSYLPAVAVLVALGIFWRFRKSWGRPCLFAFGFFALMLFPILGFFKIFFFRYSLVADHYQYYSLIAVVALIAAAVVKFFPNPAKYILGAMALACAVLTVKQCGIYRDKSVLWYDTLQKNPRCWMGEANWAFSLQEQGEILEHAGRHAEAVQCFENAIGHFNRALEIHPDDAGANENCGVCLLRVQRLDEAVQKFRRAVHLNPIYIDALDALGWYLATTKNEALRNPAEALHYAKRAVALSGERGDFDMKLESLAAAYAASGKFEQATKVQEQALEVARRLGKSSDLEYMEIRLRRYKSGQDFREGD